jgi:hypothetical protein
VIRVTPGCDYLASCDYLVSPSHNRARNTRDPLYDSRTFMPVVLLSIFASLLPRRYRGHWLGDGNLDVRRGAILSSAVQFVGCCAAMWALYPAFIHQRLAQATAAAAASHPGDKVVEGFTVFAYGQFAALEYMFLPLTLILLYFAIEGAVRIFSVVASDVLLPSMPLQIFAWAHDYAAGRFQEAKMGTRVADAVGPGVAGKYDLKIESCRPKQWNRLITIRYDDRMYELLSEETGQAPRRFVYLLRLKPEHKIVRGLHVYDPEEPVRKPGWAQVPETQRP